MAGKTFHPQTFYMTIQDVYEHYCTPSTELTPIASMKAVTFTQLLTTHVCALNDSQLAFHLYQDYKLNVSTSEGSTIHSTGNSKGGEWLCLTYLQGPCSESQAV